MVFYFMVFSIKCDDFVTEFLGHTMKKCQIFWLCFGLSFYIGLCVSSILILLMNMGGIE